MKKLSEPAPPPIEEDDDDDRTLAEIKQSIAEKAGKDETWIKLQKEIDEGKQR